MMHVLAGKREKFCQLVATDSTYTDAYLEAYEKPADYDRKLAAEAGSRLMVNADIILRVQELRRPVILKFQRKLEDSLDKALEQCQVAYDLAYAKRDAGGILKSVEMQVRLAELLSEEFNVTNRCEVFDDASTEVLLAVRKEIEIRREERKKLPEFCVVNSETVLAPPYAPALVPSNGSHLATVASSQGPNSKILLHTEFPERLIPLRCILS